MGDWKGPPPPAEEPSRNAPPAGPAAPEASFRGDQTCVGLGLSPELRKLTPQVLLEVGGRGAPALAYTPPPTPPARQPFAPVAPSPAPLPVFEARASQDATLTGPLGAPVLPERVVVPAPAQRPRVVAHRVEAIAAPVPPRSSPPARAAARSRREPSRSVTALRPSETAAPSAAAAPSVAPAAPSVAPAAPSPAVTTSNDVAAPSAAASPSAAIAPSPAVTTSNEVAASSPAVAPSGSAAPSNAVAAASPAAPPPSAPAAAPTPAARPAPAASPVAERDGVEDRRRRLFRKTALDAHYGDGDVELDALAKPKPGAWTALLVLASLVAALFVGAALAQVEVTVKAPGALRAPNGLRSVESVLSGAVSEVLVSAGDAVESGQVVVRLEDAKLRSNLVLLEKQLAALRDETEAATRADQELLERALEASKRQRAALKRQNAINYDLLKKRGERLANMDVLVRHGAASQGDRHEIDESVQAALQSLALLDSRLVDLDLQMADRTREFQARELERSAAMRRMEAQVEEARELLELVNISAPAAGRVESLLVKVGEVVEAGALMAQVVPEDAPRSIVAFLPAHETAFVAVGSEANVEIESLPVNEFGMARASVTRLSADVAQPQELATTFNEVLPGAYVRVELVLIENDTAEAMAPHLRSGDRVLVRLHSRQRRVLSLLFEFARKWLGY